MARWRACAGHNVDKQRLAESFSLLMASALRKGVVAAVAAAAAAAGPRGEIGACGAAEGAAGGSGERGFVL